MEYSIEEKNRYIIANKGEYREKYYTMKWLDYAACKAAREERDSLLARIIKNGALSGYNNTKIDVNALSPGCALCAKGRWSCLFINNFCNASCFYCPTPQKEIGNPCTNTVEFDSPESYAAYVYKFQFEGVSLSGGEPFVTFDKTLAYLRAVREKMGDALYIWLYTNGKLVTEEKLYMLKEAGLNEIRFDIGATGYSLENAKRAVGIIDTVTVEIPSVPDDFELMKTKIAEMKEAGIQHLNLHQLRATPHNIDNFIERGYTFLHGKKATVFESEINALKLIAYSLESGIRLPINYCSFIYKNLFQITGSRRRHSQSVIKNYEDLTAAGMIRSLSAECTPEQYVQAVALLNEKGDAGQYYADDAAKKIYFQEPLLDLVIPTGASVLLAYYQAGVAATTGSSRTKIALEIEGGKTIYVERTLSTDPIMLDAGDEIVVRKIIRGELASKDDLPEIFHQVYAAEVLPEGLSEYF